jgi:hypothetical protein
LAIEVWIYFSFLEFWPGAEIGTIASILITQKHPQDVVVSPTTLSLKFDPKGGLKSPLDNLFHPAKIHLVLRALR